MSTTAAAGAQGASRLGESAGVVADVLDDVEAEQQVGPAVRERQLLEATENGLTAAIARQGERLLARIDAEHRSGREGGRQRPQGAAGATAHFGDPRRPSGAQRRTVSITMRRRATNHQWTSSS